ncbi:tetratricopeptide repeat protein [Desulfonema magnum]|uniref:Tetratricopeptide repeat-containing protein n=1 Tax=Desulfonema magnum TaxID=45655 RepID=A0A975BN78_9BACT|nr:tetratricopeptide repeat protein [Desulfonema magnum]QTA88804.1 Tetratricopeptide repeat-containing protein [Desulfonema magnum]
MRKIVILTLCFLSVICLLVTGGCHSRNDKTPDEQRTEEKPDPKAWFDKGNVWAEKGDYDQAISAYNKVTEIDPLYTSAYYFRGHVWEEKGKLDKAIKDYSKVLELNPELEKAYHDRGTAWGKKGEYEKAISDFNKALELNPNDGTIYDTRGNAWQMKKEYGKAINDYVKALELNPKLFVPYNNLAWLLATCSDPAYRSGDKAVTLAEKAVELNHDVFTLDTLAAAHAEAGNFDDAVATMEKIIKLLNDRGDTSHLKIYEDHLKSYRNHKPWRIK